MQKSQKTTVRPLKFSPLAARVVKILHKTVMATLKIVSSSLLFSLTIWAPIFPSMLKEKKYSEIVV